MSFGQGSLQDQMTRNVFNSPKTAEPEVHSVVSWLIDMIEETETEITCSSMSACSCPSPKVRKNVSWSQDLETVHVFEKLDLVIIEEPIERKTNRMLKRYESSEEKQADLFTKEINRADWTKKNSRLKKYSGPQRKKVDVDELIRQLEEQKMNNRRSSKLFIHRSTSEIGKLCHRVKKKLLKKGSKKQAFHDQTFSVAS